MKKNMWSVPSLTSFLMHSTASFHWKPDPTFSRRFQTFKTGVEVWGPDSIKENHICKLSYLKAGFQEFPGFKKNSIHLRITMRQCACETGMLKHSPTQIPWLTDVFISPCLLFFFFACLFLFILWARWRWGWCDVCVCGDPCCPWPSLYVNTP